MRLYRYSIFSVLGWLLDINIVKRLASNRDAQFFSCVALINHSFHCYSSHALPRERRGPSPLRQRALRMMLWNFQRSNLGVPRERLNICFKKGRKAPSVFRLTDIDARAISIRPRTANMSLPGVCSGLSGILVLSFRPTSSEIRTLSRELSVTDEYDYDDPPQSPARTRPWIGRSARSRDNQRLETFIEPDQRGTQKLI